MKSFVVPTIAAGEFTTGYEGWLYQFNGLSRVAGDLLLRKEFDSGSHHKSKVEVLAGALKVRTQALITRHTTFPFSRAFARFNPGILHGSPHAKAKALALRNLRSERAYFCIACLREDIISYGRPYWHREHQLPGVYLCHVHFCALSFTSKDHPFDSSPAKHLDESNREYQLWAERLRANEAAMAYTEIALTLLEGEAPLSSYGVLRQLKAIAAERDLLPGTPRSLTALLRKRFDPEWLTSEFPECKDLSRSEFSTFERVIEGRRTSIRVPAYVAALSVLYDTPSQAIAGIQLAGAIARDANVTSTTKLQAEVVRKAWVQGSGTFGGTARVLGLPRKVTRRLLFTHGLPSLEGTRRGDVELFLKKFLDQNKRFCHAILTTINRRTAERISRRSLGNLLRAASALRSRTTPLVEYEHLADSLLLFLATRRHLNINHVWSFLTKFAVSGTALAAAARGSGLRTADAEWILRAGLQSLRRLLPELRTWDLLKELERINHGNAALLSKIKRLTDEMAVESNPKPIASIAQAALRTGG